MTEPEITDALARPDTVFERDENGLVKGVVYPRRPDGRIQWEKLIDPKYIVFNSNPKLADKIAAAYGKPVSELDYGDLIAEGREVDPRHVLVLLMGLIELADLRGYIAATPRIAHVVSYPPEAAICSCECTIDWISNIEEPNGKTSYGTADATMENTGGWGYLSAMAGNRAFVRAVRQGLRIPIMSFDEIAKKDTSIPEQAAAVTSNAMPLPSSTLQKIAEANKFNFDQIQQGALTHWMSLQKDPKHEPKLETDPATWTKWETVPPRDALTLIKHLHKKAKKK